jgi:hypothetical protein
MRTAARRSASERGILAPRSAHIAHSATRSPEVADPSGDAHWDFADQASKAHADWLLHCDVTDFEANLRDEKSRGVSQLLPPDPPTMDSIESDLSRSAAGFLDRHLPDVLSRHGALRPVEHIAETYGSMLGRAGSKHVRAALRRLHASGRIDDGCVGDYWLRSLRWIGD